ncbi:MAG: hypothetical protein L0Y67_03915 [Gammaproteobacteria bacterium]|nr:hypothetical protein [Gammaproteobacteria bacterium]MCI0590741.1 hypothetical protein [Gammaproteobacteria bacterium]
MNRPSHFFNVESADQLFGLLKTVASSLATSEEKRTEDFLLLIFGLTHLREWIAPDYDWKERGPVTPEEHFFQDIYKFDEFKLLKALCNCSKHMCVTDHAMGALYKSVKDTASSGNSVSKSDRRLVGYFADGKDVEDVIRAVIKFYEEKWFRNVGGVQNAT